MSTQLDDLTTLSREFYERAYMKLNASLVFASFGMFLLGLTSKLGADAAAAGYFAEYYSDFGFKAGEDSQEDVRSGSAVGAFASILGFFLAIFVALFISPMIASKQEQRVIGTPQECVNAPAPGSATAHVVPQATPSTPPSSTTSAPPIVAMGTPVEGGSYDKVAHQEE